MKAVGYIDSLPIANANALFDTEIAQPVVAGRDLLVKVNAIAVNPVDYKIRQRVASTNGKHLGAIYAENLRKAHGILESGKSIGKIVLEGFG